MGFGIRFWSILVVGCGTGLGSYAYAYWSFGTALRIFNSKLFVIAFLVFGSKPHPVFSLNNLTPSVDSKGKVKFSSSKFSSPKWFSSSQKMIFVEILFAEMVFVKSENSLGRNFLRQNGLCPV